YDTLTRSELILRIKTLENQLAKKSPSTRKFLKQEKPFDITKYGQQRIAIKVAYLGWNYYGFATQSNEKTYPTVEDQLFKALEKCRLIHHRDDCDYSRCGRTDKGVSGLGQVIALNIRSTNKKLDPSLQQQQQQNNVNFTPRYIGILNKTLPPDIRILAWAPVDATFNARFDCKSRTYKYFFQRGSLDIDLMRRAADYCVGLHDFRNFCKLDPAKNITSYERRILSFDINPVQEGGEDLYEVKLKGSAFLWNQVRCIMAILFLVGQKLESPEVMKDLLDVEKVPAKPQYAIAHSLPLVLYDCEYEKKIDWIYIDGTKDDTHNLITPLNTYRLFHEMWEKHAIHSILFKTFFKQIEQFPISSLDKRILLKDDLHKDGRISMLLGAGTEYRTRHYVKLLDRPRVDSHEVKTEKYRLKMNNK
ncbi:pseudouridine synthase, partial [Cokeromyces recurvatus]|uniref:pseudouridine synthase n=1 Tax=Cokeromyces recurvatus TaxID=90255 RepID=UPI002220F07A